MSLSAEPALDLRESCDRALRLLEDRGDYGQVSPDEVQALVVDAAASGDIALLWRARRLEAELRGRGGEVAYAMHTLSQVQEFAEQNGHARLLARAHLSLAWNCRDIGDHTGYLDHAIQAVERLDADAPASVRSLHLIRLADALDECGSRAEAQARYTQAEEVAQRAGDLTRQVSCLNNRAYGELVAGDVTEAQSTVARLIDLCLRHDLPLRAHTLDTIARLHIRTERYAEAVMVSLQATDAYHRQGVLEVLAPAEFLLTRACAERVRGHYDAAQLCIDESRALGRSAGLASLLAQADEEQAELHAARGDFESAYHSYQAFHSAEKELLSEQRATQSLLRQAVLGTAEVRREADQLRHAAVHDPLTGLPNRRYLNETLPGILADRGSDDVVAVAMVDLDHFKRINDTCSHAAGDRVLVTVAALLESAIVRWQTATSGNGFAARIGGEEFVVVLTGGRNGDAEEHLNRLRLSVAERDWSPTTGQVPVTMSAGMSRATPDDTRTTLLHRADELLYAAKHAGRNQVQCDKAPTFG